MRRSANSWTARPELTISSANPMTRLATLPFSMSRKQDEYRTGSVTSTRETVQGVLHLEGAVLRITWRRAVRTDHYGAMDMRSDQDVEEVRHVELPLTALGRAWLREPRWLRRFRGSRLVLTATDLRAFEGFAGPEGLGLEHAGRVELRIAREDRLEAAEFLAELEMAQAQRLLDAGDP